MKTLLPGKNKDLFAEAATAFKNANCVVALTGAGISVNSGIADFRSPGGVWTSFSPEEYATLDVFRRSPAKAWKLYRELGKGLIGKKPNKAHKVLATFESNNHLKAIITQNVDNLHQMAGNRNVLEIHGDHQHLQCLECGDLVEVTETHLTMPTIPHCSTCNYPYKPNVVLFGEAVRHLEAIEAIIHSTDLLLVIGTSAKVYPAATLPAAVKSHGGKIYEFNMESALIHSEFGLGSLTPDYFFEGDLSITLPAFEKAVLSP